MEAVEQRFLRYTKIDTQSCDSSESTPSTPKQFDLLNLLKEELEQMGLSDVILTEKGYLYATLKSNTTKELPTIGLIAHVDTSPDMSGKDVKGRVIKYEGGDIVLSSESGIVTPVADFPELNDYIGHDLIVTDGTTLLGADDKAGVAEIMAAMEYLQENPTIEHGEIKVGFTPDEEIGRGADHFDVELFGADFAYTFDGSTLGELEYENFNAAQAIVDIQGRNVHPGYAKDKMVNAFTVAMQFDSKLPALERPEHTSGYEGFYHLVSLGGSVDRASMTYIIRDHDDDIFFSRIAKIEAVGAEIDKIYGSGTAKVTIKQQYRNMRSKIEDGNMHVIEYAKASMANIGVVPKIRAIRGGTDGCRLSFMGLPTPNIFAGGVNYHGRHEFISVEVMNKAFELAVEICKA